jgi:hypothetical protein
MSGHWLPECPEGKPKVKKKWVKPELRVYKRVDKMSTEYLMERGIDAVSTNGVDKIEKRRQRQREWVKRKREADRGK